GAFGRRQAALTVRRLRANHALVAVRHLAVGARLAGVVRHGDLVVRAVDARRTRSDLVRAAGHAGGPVGARDLQWWARDAGVLVRASHDLVVRTVDAGAPTDVRRSANVGSAGMRSSRYLVRAAGVARGHGVTDIADQDRVRRTTREAARRGWIRTGRWRTDEARDRRALLADGDHLLDGHRGLRGVTGGDAEAALAGISGDTAREPVVLGEHLADLAPVVVPGRGLDSRRGANRRVESSEELLLVHAPVERRCVVGPVVDEGAQPRPRERDDLVLGVPVVNRRRDDERRVVLSPEVA